MTTALILAAAQATPVRVRPQAVAFVACALAVWVLVLWARRRVLRGRLARSLSRSLSAGRRPTVRNTRRMAARSISARRAARRFRAALLFSVLIVLVWLVIQLHGPTS